MVYSRRTGHADKYRVVAEWIRLGDLLSIDRRRALSRRLKLAATGRPDTGAQRTAGLTNQPAFLENNTIVNSSSIVMQLRQLGFVTAPNVEEFAPIDDASLHDFPQQRNCKYNRAGCESATTRPLTVAVYGAMYKHAFSALGAVEKPNCLVPISITRTRIE